MKHCLTISKTPAVAAVTPLETKLNGVIQIFDRLLLAGRQSAWKAPFPVGGTTDTTTTTTTTI